ncbi:hypothetical protein JCM3775_003228 [Rhodotorula graminis]
MDLISHKLDAAKDKLERAAMAGSSAGCATLAGILARESRTASPSHVGHHHLSPPPTSLSPPAAPAPVRRPSIPTRQSSSSIARTAPHRSPDALRAVELSLTGLQLLLLKPVRPSSDSGYGGSDDDDEDSAEGLYFDLERALDLIARVTDAHRFGVLHAPLSDPQQHDSSPGVDGSGANDDLWRRSATAAVKLLDHETVTVLFSHPAAAAQPPFLSRSSSSRRRSSSVSRSFAHPSSTLPLDTDVKGTAASLLSPERKLKVTVAVHALYVLALQAWAVQHGPSSPTLSSPSSAAEDPKLVAERYWSTIERLAAPYAPFAGIGIKEGDEIVQSTQRRLESIRHQDLGPDEPWRLAKKRGRQTPAAATSASPTGATSATSAQQDEGSSAVTIRPALVPQPSTSSGSFGGRTPRGASFHLGPHVDEADAEEEEEEVRAAPVSLDMPSQNSRPVDAAAARSPPFALSPPHDLLLSPPSSTSSNKPASSSSRTSQPYPSPPETPPIASDAHAFYPDFQPRAPSTLSPPSPSASRLQPLVSPSAGATSSGLPRVTSVRSIASNRSTTSVLSTFKHDPLQRYLSGRLRRVGSSASICTAPPDLSGRTRVCRGKGKGKMVEPEPSELFELRGGAGGAALERAKSRPSALATVEEAEPKTWLSRFWRSSRSALDDGGRGAPAGLAAAAEEGALDRTRSSSAVHALKLALDRHDEASSTMVMYWGEGEGAYSYAEEDEEGQGEVDEPVSPAADKVTSPPASSLRFDEAQLSQADKLRSSLDAKPQHSTRQPARQRSFLLTDPTSSPASASASANTSLSRDRTRSSRRARSRDTSVHSSASSTHSTTADGHLAPPSPSKSGRRRRRRSSAGARSSAGSDDDDAAPPVPVAMDPLLLELERRSHIGLKTACAACGRRGLNFPACRKCTGTYCSRDCRVGPQHVCRRPGAAAAAKAAAQA